MMGSTRIAIATMSAMLMAGCAVLGGPAPQRAQPRHVAGDYYTGDGLGTNIYLVLREDGTYESTWYGCLGEYGSARGSWLLDAGTIRFEPTVETGMMVHYLQRGRIARDWPNYRIVSDRGDNPADVLYRDFP